jgi:WD40 repeat protein
MASVTATLAVAAFAFAPAYVQILANTANSDHAKLCGRPYKLAKPLAPQRILRDPNSKGIQALAFCPNGSFLAAADRNGHVYVWSMATREIVTAVHDPASRGVTDVAYRPRTRTLAAGDADGSVYLWQPGRIHPRRLRDPRSKGVRALAFSPGGRFMAVADANGHTYVWAMATHKIILTLHVPGSGSVNDVAFSGAGTTIATGNANGTAYEWTFAATSRGRLRARFHDPGSRGINAVAFRPRTATLATADNNGRAFLWPPGAHQPIVLTDAKPARVTAERFTPNGQVLATVDAASHLLFWSLAKDRIVELLPLRGSGALRAVTMSPDTRRVAAGDVNGKIYISDSTHIGINVVLTGHQH